MVVIAAAFVAALLTATFLLTGSRQDAQPDLPTGAQGVWRAQSSNTDATLNDVVFADSNRGWAVGVGGAVLHTSDGGSTWEQQDSGTDVTLLKASFVSPEEGWAVGKLGVVIHTRDGGKTWERQAADTTLGLNLIGVSFVDAQNGWVMTERGSVILKTEDGGKTWVRQFLNNTGLRSDLAFVDARQGWAVFAGGSLLHTAEGGETWAHQAGVNEVQLGTTGAFFLDENIGWISGWRGKRQGIRSGVQFLRFLTDGMVARTTDGGATWTRHDSDTGHTLMDVAFVDTLRGWAVGAFGTIVSSSDGGITWTPWPSGTEAGLKAVAFADGNNGWAVGEDGTILKFGPR